MPSKKEKLEIDLEDIIELNIQIVPINGKHGLQFRRTVSMCDKNLDSIKDIISKALDSDSDLIMPVRLKIFNKDLAIYKLKELGKHYKNDSHWFLPKKASE